MTAADEGKLRKLIKEHVEAQIDLSWIGSKMAEEHGEIELQAQVAKERLNDFITFIAGH